MNNFEYLEKYAKTFGYKEFSMPSIEYSKNKIVYLKENRKGFIVIEKLLESKYVNFYFNDKFKIFKASDLIHALIDNTPVAWEEELCQ